MNVEVTAAAEDWLSIVRDRDSSGAPLRLAELYRRSRPTVAEIIFSADCEFACAHCIYAPTFAVRESGVTGGQWEAIARRLIEDLGVDTFVYSGRAVTNSGARFLAWLRETFPALRIGLIDNGISMRQHAELLLRARPDWIDLSFDGLAADHDRQRGRPGAFQDGLVGAQWVRDSGVTKIGSISTCLTTLNRGSLVSMIRELRLFGYHNFFVIPLVLGDGVRPNQRHMLSGSELALVVRELRDLVVDLGDVWVELNLYMPEYLTGLLGEGGAELAGTFPATDSHLRNTLIGTDRSHFSVGYYPISLTGTRELVINGDGDLLVPRAISKEVRGDSEMFGNLLRDDPVEAVRALPNGAKFAFYAREIQRELEVLSEIHHGLG